MRPYSPWGRRHPSKATARRRRCVGRLRAPGPNMREREHGTVGARGTDALRLALSQISRNMFKVASSPQVMEGTAKMLVLAVGVRSTAGAISVVMKETQAAVAATAATARRAICPCCHSPRQRMRAPGSIRSDSIGEPILYAISCMCRYHCTALWGRWESRRCSRSSHAWQRRFVACPNVGFASRMCVGLCTLTPSLPADAADRQSRAPRVSAHACRPVHALHRRVL